MRLLKKELATLDKDQLIEVILTAYSASKETKEFFDFFLNPDTEKLVSQYEELIIKEFRRTKHGYHSKARINTIRRIIKKFSSFQPGDEYVLNFYLFTIRHAFEVERNLYFTNVLYNGVRKLADDLMKYADKHLLFEPAISGLSELLNSDVPTSRFRKLFN